MATAQRVLVEAESIPAGGDISHNLAGQKLGRKGRDTRDRIIAATLEVLEESEDMIISLSAVARKAKLGMTSIYVYFADLTELLLAVLEPVTAEGQTAYLEGLCERWPDDALDARSRQFLDAYYDFWKRHSRILHLRNVLADRHDERMMQVRVGAAMPILQGIRQQFAPEGKELDPRLGAMASVLVAGIERSITLSTDTSIPARLAKAFAPAKEPLIDAAAQLMVTAIRESRSAGAKLA